MNNQSSLNSNFCWSGKSLQFLYCLNKGLSFLHIFRSNGMIFRNTLLKSYFESALIPLSLKGKRRESFVSLTIQNVSKVVQRIAILLPVFTIHASNIILTIPGVCRNIWYLVSVPGTEYRLPATDISLITYIEFMYMCKRILKLL